MGRRVLLTKERGVMSVLHPCPRCKKLIPVGQRYCAACAPVAAEEHRERRREEMGRYNRSRDPKLTRFYNSGVWRNLSAARLDMYPRCEAGLDDCQGTACEVHHKKPLRTPEGWAERLEWDNLMSVCTRCHNKLDAKWGKVREKNSGDRGVIDLSSL